VPLTTATTQSLSVEEQYRLLTDVQNVPTTITVQDDGSEYVVYGVTPASESAGGQLLAAFMPAIRAAARRTKLKGNEEEAEAVALEEFVRAVREYDLTSSTPFHHTIATRLTRAVMLADREEASAVTIPAVQIARYHRALHAHDLDPTAAMRACAEDPKRWLLSGDAFRAVHTAMSRPAFHGGGPFRDERVNEAHDAYAAGEPAVSTEDEVLDREHARWLLSQTTDRQERISRLAYGFTDLPTQSLRVAKGYRESEPLDDGQVADCLGTSRPTVGRERNAALATMRAAHESALNE
jgi:hypothetical protein